MARGLRRRAGGEEEDIDGSGEKDTQPSLPPKRSPLQKFLQRRLYTFAGTRCGCAVLILCAVLSINAVLVSISLVGSKSWSSSLTAINSRRHGVTAILGRGKSKRTLQDVCGDPLDNIGERLALLAPCNEPIDVVYTWVNGSDPEWEKEMLYWKAKAEADRLERRGGAYESSDEEDGEEQQRAEATATAAPSTSASSSAAVGQGEERGEGGNPNPREVAGSRSGAGGDSDFIVVIEGSWRARRVLASASPEQDGGGDSKVVTP